VSCRRSCSTKRSNAIPPIYAPPRQGDVKDSQADITKAADLLGYKPIVSFEDGLKRTIDWYKAAHVTL